MFPYVPIEPVDYLVIGHLTVDLTPQGKRLGGTAAYSALMAKAMGLRVGIVTSWAEDLPLGPLADIPMINMPCFASSTFENIETPAGRLQKIHQRAENLDYFMIPERWRSVEILHLGPVAQEVEPGIVRYFTNALIGLTPQGWLRHWDKDGWVSACEWPEAPFVLHQAGAAVISIDDVGGDEERIEEFAASTRLLVVTENVEGCRLFWNGDVRRFRAPTVPVVDATGAGDVFAAAFFTRLYITRDPWEAARFATQMASLSITRPGLEGIPTPEEIQNSLVEVY